MNMKQELVLGGVGTTLGVVGTATQINEILQTISLIVTILGALVSFVIVPILSWYKNSKRDGKIDEHEIEEGIETAIDGAKKLKEVAEEAKKEFKKGEAYAEKVEEANGSLLDENHQKGGNKNG